MDAAKQVAVLADESPHPPPTLAIADNLLHTQHPAGTAPSNQASRETATASTQQQVVASLRPPIPGSRRRRRSTSSGSPPEEQAIERGGTSRPNPKRRRHNRHTIMRGENGSAKLFSDAPRTTDGVSPSPKLKANGHAPSQTNGDHTTLPSTLAPTFFGHDREEVTRILIQGLQDLGYSSAANTLRGESKYELESANVTSFRGAILAGDWAEAEALLSNSAEEIGGVYGSSQTGSDGMERESLSHGSGLTLGVDADRGEMLFMIRQQKYLELLELRDVSSALVVLRQELHPLHQDQHQLHALSSLIMCRSTEDLKSQANWDGAQGDSRKTLLLHLSRGFRQMSRVSIA